MLITKPEKKYFLKNSDLIYPNGNLISMKPKDNVDLVQLREVKPSYVSFRTIRYSKKKMMQNLSLDYCPNYRTKTSSNSNSLGGESFLEDSLMVLLEHSNDVKKYLPQSLPKFSNEKVKKLQYSLEGSGIIEWTPDMSTLWVNHRPIIFEVKPLNWIKQLAPEAKQRLYSKWTQAQEYANKINCDFMVFTNKFVDLSWRIENLRDLEAQMRFSNPEIEIDIMKWFQDVESKLVTVRTIQNFFESPTFSKEMITKAVCSLIYKQELFVDLEQEFSFNKSNIYLPSNKRKNIPLYDWLKNYQFDWKSDKIDIQCSSDSKIINRMKLTEYQKKTEKEKNNIIQAIKDGICYKDILKKYKISFGKFQKLNSLYLQFSSGKISEFEFKKAMIPQKPKGRTKQKLFSIDAQGNAVFLDQIFKDAINTCLETQNRMNLADTWRYYKRFKRREAFQLSLTPRFNETISELKKIAIKSDLFSHASFHVFKEEIKRYSKIFHNRVIRKREGIKRANKETKICISTTPYRNYIGQMVQIDHTPADIINSVALPVSIMLENQNIAEGIKIKRYYMERPVITVLEDIHTGVILGYMFRYRKPSIESDFQAMTRMMIGNISPLLSNLYEDNERAEKEIMRSSTISKITRGIKGLATNGLISEDEFSNIQNEFDLEYPDNLCEIADWWDNIRVMPYLLHMDNGKDFTSKLMKEFLAKYRINAGYRPVGGSQYGGHVERLLGTLNRQAFHSMTGNTKNSITSRKDYPSEKLAVLTFEQLEAILLLAILRYHATPNSEDHLSPREKWRQSAQENGHNLHFLPSGKISNITDNVKSRIQQLAWDLTPHIKVKFNRSDGIQIKNIKYNDLELSKYLNNKDEVTMKYTRSDIRFVWWWHPVEKRPYPIWAKKFRMGERIYNREQLKRLPPISDLHYADTKKLGVWKMGMEKSKKLERITNRCDNVLFTVFDEIPKNTREIKKVDKDIARRIEKSRILQKEIEESETYIDSELKDSFQTINDSNQEHIRNKTKKDQLDGVSVPESWSQPIEIPIEKIDISERDDYSFSNIEIKNEELLRRKKKHAK